MSIEIKTLATAHNSLKQDLECLEDENEKISSENFLLNKKEKELSEEIQLKDLENQRIRNDYNEELSKVTKLLELNEVLKNENNDLNKHLEEKEKTIAELKETIEKNSKNFEKKIKDQSENFYRIERTLKRNEFEIKDRDRDLEELKRNLEDLKSELHKYIYENQEIKAKNEDLIQMIEKNELTCKRDSDETIDLIKDLKEIVNDFSVSKESEEHFSQEFKNIRLLTISNPLETLKEIVILAFKELQVEYLFY